jgi:hypothetical protein
VEALVRREVLSELGEVEWHDRHAVHSGDFGGAIGVSSRPVPVRIVVDSDCRHWSRRSLDGLALSMVGITLPRPQQRAAGQVPHLSDLRADLLAAGLQPELVARFGPASAIRHGITYELYQRPSGPYPLPDVPFRPGPSWLLLAEGRYTSRE